MATLCKTFTSPELALRAAEALSAAGVPAGDVGVLRADQQDTPVTDDDAHRMLTQADVPDGVAWRMVRQLHEGSSVMFVRLIAFDLATAEALVPHEPIQA